MWPWRVSQREAAGDPVFVCFGGQEAGRGASHLSATPLSTLVANGCWDAGISRVLRSPRLTTCLFAKGSSSSAGLGTPRPWCPLVMGVMGGTRRKQLPGPPSLPPAHPCPAQGCRPRGSMQDPLRGSPQRPLSQPATGHGCDRAPRGRAKQGMRLGGGRGSESP